MTSLTPLKEQDTTSLLLHIYRGIPQGPVPTGSVALCGRRKQIPPAFMSNTEALGSGFPVCGGCLDFAARRGVAA